MPDPGNVRRLGLLTALRCRFDRIWLGAVCRAFKCDTWHSNAPFSCRPYKQKVVGLVNALRPDTVVEVGCGLGDILSRVRARDRYGIDADAGVIRAARFLHPGNVRWIHGDGSSVERHVPARHWIDCMIMVNWIHNLSPEHLAALLYPLLPRIGYLVLDAVDADGPPFYRFKHDFSFLSGVTERVSVLRASGEPRSFILFKVKR